MEDGNLIQVHDSSLSWQEDALLNDVPERDFNLNNLSIFQTPLATPISALSTYPLIPSFLLPSESSSLRNHDLSHVPISSAPQPRVEPSDLEGMHMHVPVGEGSSHNILISHSPHPSKEDRDFWTVGETVKHVVSPHVISLVQVHKG